MKLHKTILFLIILIVCRTALALPAWVTSNPAYRELLADLLTESDQFDGFTEPKQDVARFQSEFKALLTTENLEKSLPPGQTWHAIWPPKAWRVSLAGATGVITARRVQIFPSEKHSIHDPLSFVKNRLGEKVVKLAAARQIAVEVIAGNLNSFSQLYKGYDAIEVPSFYAAWGIKKYLVKTSGVPKLVFLIPPIREYADHYGAMFKVVGVDAALKLDESARTAMQANFLKEMNDLNRAFPLANSHVVFGYTRQFVASHLTDRRKR